MLNVSSRGHGEFRHPKLDAHGDHEPRSESFIENQQLENLVHGEIGRPTESLYHARPPQKPKMVSGKNEARPHPGLLPQEKESLFPRLVNLSALGLRWFMGSMREFFGEFFSLGEKAAKRRCLKVHCASVCSSVLVAPAGG